MEEWQCSSIDELVDLAKRRQYRDPQLWAAKMWTEQRKRKASREYARKQQMDFYEKLAIEGMMK